MNKSIIDIIDYVLEYHEHLNIVQQCNYIVNNYDIEITDEILTYIKMNS